METDRAGWQKSNPGGKSRRRFFKVPRLRADLGHINRLENFWRNGYHHTPDNSKKMDWTYASDIGTVAIQTAAILAGK